MKYFITMKLKINNILVERKMFAKTAFFSRVKSSKIRAFENFIKFSMPQKFCEFLKDFREIENAMHFLYLRFFMLKKYQESDK